MKRKSESGNKPAFVKRKTELVFDPNKRKEFLTGFHKRKEHRKKLAQGDLQRKLKEEVRRIRHEAKDNVKKLYHSYKPIPELSAADREEDEYDTENVTVKVVELSTTDLAKQNNWIGENSAVVRDEEETDEEQEEDQSSSDGEDIDTVPGMELEGEKPKKKKSKPSNDSEDDQDEPEDKVTPAASGKEKRHGPVLNLDGVRSKKELNKKLKRHAQKSMQKSKAFQRSVRVQQQKQLKDSRRVRHFKTKHLKRRGKLQDGVKQGKKRGGGRD
ncbi:nucleolar protein 12 [Aedes aegypti]|uniref:Nucleolar protein 12 n=1 Tax=Aedes aegypti TaxID=7159 RepID=A0A1S4EUS9_AEDAE|nr:nucleolar protein 12 [Aedes aegypti]